MTSRRPILWKFLPVLVALSAFAVYGVADEGDSPQAVLETLSSSEKESLQSKLQRFKTLKPDEQQRLRDLHQRIEEHKDSDKLVQIMENYNEWLSTLSASRRAEILALPKEERIQEIKEQLESSERRRRRWTGHLSRSDRGIVNGWLDKFAVEHREQLIDENDKFLTKFEETRGTRRMMLMHATRSKPDVRQLLLSELPALVDQLSDDAKQKYNSAKSESDKMEVVRQWMISQLDGWRVPKVKKEVLLEYFATLSADERKHLEMLDRDGMFHELGRMYLFKEIRGKRPPGMFPPWDRGGPGRRRGGGPGGPPDRERRPGPGPGDGNQLPPPPFRGEGPSPGGPDRPEE
ncbi:MAG: hypothetical protein KDB27_07235 [Planctomycetales bacterium]|nr:hypothetical protein [Planctomycetales bacterium]